MQPKEITRFKEEELIRITVVGQYTDTSIWAVGVHNQRKEPALFNNQRSIEKPSQELLDEQPVFLFLVDFMKFCPYEEYDNKSVDKAFDLARKLSGANDKTETKT